MTEPRVEWGAVWEVSLIYVFIRCLSHHMTPHRRNPWTPQVRDKGIQCSIPKLAMGLSKRLVPPTSRQEEVTADKRKREVQSNQ